MSRVIYWIRKIITNKKNCRGFCLGCRYYQICNGAKKNTTIFWEDDYPSFNLEELHNTKITITKNRSYEAAMKLDKEIPESKIAVMNFANAFHAGGGVTKPGMKRIMKYLGEY